VALRTVKRSILQRCRDLLPRPLTSSDARSGRRIFRRIFKWLRVQTVSQLRAGKRWGNTAGALFGLAGVGRAERGALGLSTGRYTNNCEKCRFHGHFCKLPRASANDELKGGAGDIDRRMPRLVANLLPAPAAQIAAVRKLKSGEVRLQTCL
jgi:hypothetical protein